VEVDLEAVAIAGGFPVADEAFRIDCHGLARVQRCGGLDRGGAGELNAGERQAEPVDKRA